ncbi:endonuclease III [Halarsenatibacter silvermanii]|uniref:Endonuclease III n=1 Tax=Halarsenatibacter silvermanii TaxID=321763 RepID=A0A1G9NWH5_9FIRM|nr:endonuclease III [Halarsenatibacter silvermanii]SDL90714.1 DNA-(apurinic or apyrimidinic site) lyase /endonuclease III [Halarsenatibacter silvermanii]
MQLQQEKAKKISGILSEKYPVPETALDYKTPFQLLVATILSAQTTDTQVNKVTSDLFEKYSRPQDFAELEVETLSEEIKSIGLHRSKSEYIIKSSRMIIDIFEGEVPRSFDDLLKLNGVGRKTASVVIYAAFSRPAFPVDTHVFRVSRRLGLADGKNPEKVEEQLKELFPEDDWGDMHHRLIYHGREVCKARSPDCSSCQLQDFCDYFKNNFK